MPRVITHNSPDGPSCLHPSQPTVAPKMSREERQWLIIRISSHHPSAHCSLVRSWRHCHTNHPWTNLLRYPLSLWTCSSTNHNMGIRHSPCHILEEEPSTPFFEGSCRVADFHSLKVSPVKECKCSAPFLWTYGRACSAPRLTFTPDDRGASMIVDQVSFSERKAAGMEYTDTCMA
jgi:hypothetical protein